LKGNIMKPFSRIFKLLLAASAVSAALIGTPAMAGPLFTVDEGSVPGTTPNLVEADRISFEYHAIIDQTIVGGDGLAGAGDTFIETGFLTKAAFGSPTGGSVPSQLNALGGYRIYGLFTITGEADPFGATGILATFQTLTMTLYIDPDQNTILGLPVAGPVIPGGVTGDDFAIATFTLNLGEAHVFDSLANGDFDTLLNLTLTPAGQLFFVSPSPFFALENFGGNTQTFNITSGDITTGFTAIADGGGLELFIAAVPEPASIALFGIGLLGLGMSNGRKNKNRT
jgi:hypothetical protein